MKNYLLQKIFGFEGYSSNFRFHLDRFFENWQNIFDYNYGKQAV